MLISSAQISRYRSCRALRVTVSRFSFCNSVLSGNRYAAKWETLTVFYTLFSVKLREIVNLFIFVATCKREMK